VDVVAIATALLAPAAVFLGVMAIVAASIVAMAEIEPAGGRLVKPRSEVQQP
jgi:hypothetical protein